MNPKVSILSVNYNGMEHTCAMIESVARHVRTPHELIVVDNGSVIDETAEISRRYPHVVVLRSDRNLGFAGGNNLGLRIARGEYILLLNNDTLIEHDVLAPLCERLDGDPQAGAVCPKIRFAFPPRAIQFAGYTPLTSVTLRNRLIGFDRPDDGSFDTPRRTPYAHGAAMMVRKKTVEAVGYMPEIYFLYYEELDWSSKITALGYTIWYEPRGTVFHKESASTGAESPLKAFYMSRNRLLYGWRNRTGAARWLGVLYQVCVASAKNIALSLLHGRTDLAKASAKGILAFFRLKHKME